MRIFFSKMSSALPTLYTRRLILRPIRMRDARDMFQYSRDPEVARYVLWREHTSVADTRSYIRYIISQYKRGKPSSWAIARQTDDRMIGTIGFSWVDDCHNSGELGYSLARSEWNKGYMTESLWEMLRYGFDEMRLHRIEAQHEPDNLASGAVMKKCGMKKEGYLRGRLYNKGEYVDTLLYAMILDDWQSMQR